jgi:phosphoribosylanthranilate isomerase
VSVWVKICGITNEADARLCVEAGADALGFIFYPRSKRAVTPGAAGAIARTLPRHVMRVGVFVDAPLCLVERVRGLVGLDLVQLHGREPPGYADALGSVMKAFRKGESRAKVATFRDCLVMFDGPSGGSGQSADMALARHCARARPVVLAGGLRSDTVSRAIRDVRPWGVDVASGTEAAPGRKDAAKVRAFIDAARAV